MGKNIVKALTKANIKAYGIERAPQYDFNDDGNHFRGFIYKGMPMTQCYAKTDGEVYLSIRVDYLTNNFTWNEWFKTEESDLCKEFNGASEIDMDKLVENLERVIAKREELNNNATIDPQDCRALKSYILQEVAPLEAFVETVKANFHWWKAKEYQLTSVASHMKSLMNGIQDYYQLIKAIEDKTPASVRSIREYIERMHKGEKIHDYSCYMKWTTEIMERN